MTATLVADVGEGNFFAQNIDDVCSGLSPLRIRPSNSVDADGLTAQNQMHTLMVTGTDVSQASTVQMMVMNQEIEVPTDAFIFTSILQHRWGEKLQRIISVLYEINFIPC
jgi:hypothetical protein